MLWQQSPEVRREKRKNKFLMAIICGPLFAITLTVVMYLLSFLPEGLTEDSRFIIWPAAGSGCASAAAVADRLGKHYGLTPQEFAGPVAFSCVIFPLLTWYLLIRFCLP